MANVKVVLDTRREKGDGTYPIYLRLIHDRKSRNIMLGYDVSEKLWNERTHEVRNSYPNSTRVNLHIQKKLTAAMRVIVDHEEKLNVLSIDELKNLILSFDIKTSTHRKEVSLLKYGKKVVERYKKANKIGSAAMYKNSLAAVKRFKKDKDVLLADVNYKFLVEYEADLLSRKIKTNSIGGYLRHLRAILNMAIDEGLLQQEHYPFRKFRIKKEKSVKRAIPKEEILKIINAKFEEDSDLWHCRNYFAFMFNMCGMNFADLARLKMEDIQDGRVIYRRIKTGKLYNIKLTKEAQNIIDHYTKDRDLKQEAYIFPIIPLDVIGDAEKEWERVKDKRKHFNNDLKAIGKVCKINTNLTSYVIRHSWASIAKFAGIAPAVIGESLGHSDLATTEAYLAEFEHDILDQANEVITS